MLISALNNLSTNQLSSSPLTAIMMTCVVMICVLRPAGCHQKLIMPACDAAVANTS